MAVSRGLLIASGGLDSTVTAALALEQGIRLDAVTFLYGQRHEREVEAARAVCQQYDIPLEVVQLPVIVGSALTGNTEVPLDRHLATLDEAMAPTYVPNRNMIMLSHAAAIAYTRGIEELWGGWNVLDASNYPDCREAFLASVEATLLLATLRPFRIHRPLIALSKAEIVGEGLRTRAPLALTWSCYLGEGRPCLRCDTCQLRSKGFWEAGFTDPALTPEEWVVARSLAAASTPMPRQHT